MRDFLTGIAVFVILVLTTVLVAPYFVDWNGQRAFLEARLSAALGQKVTIGGHIDLKILPTPYLVLDQVVVGGDDGAVRIGIHHVDLELSVAPLLHGAFDIVEARLQEPTIRIGLQSDRTVPVLPTAPAFQADVHFDRIQVSDGTLAIADPTSGRTFTFDHIDLDADAGSFTGPFKIAGAGGPPDQRTRFRLSTAAPDKGRARTRLTVEETSGHPAVELDGTLDLTSGDVALPQSFEGRLVLGGHLTGLQDDPPPWTLSGPIHIDTHGAAVANGDLRLGSEDAGLTLLASLKADFGDRPTMAMNVSAKQIDIDRLSGAPVDAVKPPPPKLPDLATIRQVIAAANPPLATTVEVAIDNATYGGEALSEIRAKFGVGSTTPQPVALSASGPAGSRLAIAGTLSPGAYTPFAGDLNAEAENLGHALAWLSTIAPNLPWHGADAPFASLHVTGHILAGGNRADSDKLTIALDRSVFSGPAHLVLGGDAIATKLSTNLSAEDLDFDGLPAMEATRATLNGLDLDLRVRADSLKIASFGSGSLTTGPFDLALTKAGQRIDLTDMRIENVGGANLIAAGRLDASETALTIDVDASRLDTAAALVKQLFPGAAAEALVARASALAPARFKMRTNNAGGTTPPTFTLSGSLNTTRVEASLNASGADDDAVALSGSLKAADGGVLLRQLVAGDAAVKGLGPAELRFSAAGKAPAIDANFTGTLGATQIGFKGQLKALAWPLTGNGMATMQSEAIGPLLEAVKLGSRETSHLPVALTASVGLEGGSTDLRDISGKVGAVATTGSLNYRFPQGDEPALTGSIAVDHLSLPAVTELILGPSQEPTTTGWSQGAFAGGLQNPPRTALSVKAQSLELGQGHTAEQASFDLALDPSALRIEHLASKLGDGTVNGRALVRRDGGQATIEGKLALTNQRLDAASFTAKLDATLDFAGSGTSPAAVVANLAGSGAAIASRFVVRQADPAALIHLLKDVETDALAIDQDAIVRAFDDAAKAPLDVGSQKFNLGLASGLMRFSPAEPFRSADSSSTTKIDGSYDFGRARLDARLEEALVALPENWSGPPPTIAIDLAGPLGKLTRTVDVSNFVNALAARALARETARIDAYELDIRERSFFNARLQAEKRHEEDKKAETERKAKLEAGRLERARQEEATRAAREALEVLRPNSRDDKAARRSEPRPATSQKEPSPPAPQSPAASDPSTMGRY